jgi:hypothetical protein
MSDMLIILGILFTVVNVMVLFQTIKLHVRCWRLNKATNGLLRDVLAWAKVMEKYD